MELKDLEKFEKLESNLIEVLNMVQDKEGYISLDNQVIISEFLGVSMAKIYSVITFYSRFSLEPSAKYNVSVCTGTACYVKGASNLLEKLKSELNLDINEISSDGLFKIVENRCVGACSLAPVLLVNDKIYGKCTDEELVNIINELRGNNE